jgi:hypothetical protein
MRKSEAEDSAMPGHARWANVAPSQGVESIAQSELAHMMKISESDLHLLGLSDEYARPEWMILTILPVPPPPVRPSIAVDGGTMRSEDDLTYKLGEIIRSSTDVRKSEQEGSPAHIVTEYEQLLQVCRIPYVTLTIAVERSPVPRRYLHGQRYCGYSPGAAEVRSSRKGYPRPPEGKGGSSSWQLDGQACRLFCSNRHHGRSESRVRRSRCAAVDCNEPD